MSKQKYILFVDDDPGFLDATTNVLESFGYRIRKALNPKECFEALKEELPDLILLDVMMARLDSGFDCCRKLKADDRTKGIPILMLTAIDKKYPFDFAKSSGDPDWLPADGFIDKPVEAIELVEHIRKLLKEK